MRASVVFVVLLGVVLCGLTTTTAAVPVQDEVADLDFPAQYAPENTPLSRRKRDACDMPEFLSMNTAACTTSCFFRGYKSGSCILSLCVCKNW